MIEFDVTVRSGDLYDYMLRHTYNSPAGLLGNGVGAVMVVAGAMRNQWPFVVLGFILLLYLPWTLWLKSKRQALHNPAFGAPLHYVMDEKGISVSQNGETQTQKWEDMYRAVSTSKSIIVYTTKVHACIFPRRETGSETARVIRMICTHMEPGRVKIRQ